MPSKNEPSKAEAVRGVLTKHPNYSAKQAIEALAKGGLNISTANFYDTKSRMVAQGLIPGTPGVKKSKRKIKRSIKSKPETTMSESVELELARREINKLRAVIATLL